MPLSIPKNNPLTSTQSEVTAKIGSMKNLLELPFVEFKTIPKQDQISTFDYLLKLLEAQGIPVETTFHQFFSRVLDEGKALEDMAIEGIGRQLMFLGIKLPGETFKLLDTTVAEQGEIQAANIVVIKEKMEELGLTNFLQTAKQKIVKDLTLAIFGPKDGPAAEYLNPDPAQRQRIIENAICAVDAFSLSNNGFVRDEDVEYNRIALAKQLEKGEIILEISCQKVKIKLPEDPSWIFEGGGVQTISSNPKTPSQSIKVLATYVESTAQQINNQENAKSGGKTFMQILIEKFISNITNLIQPYLGPILGPILEQFSGVLGQIEFPNGGNAPTQDDLVTSTCEILNDTSPNPTKKAFGESLANQLYKLLLNMLLMIAMREFKKLVKNYFARIYRERGKRKVEKIKARFAISDDSVEKAKKAAAYAKAAASLASVIGEQIPT